MTQQPAEPAPTVRSCIPKCHFNSQLNFWKYVYNLEQERQLKVTRRLAR